jgi:prepilin-type N-terminal cleavage/methylation domain-containing protein/prepilin-type processing-associated H-X9-DG protein
MKKKSAFTLIELLVVVAIIAILAALLFPNLSAIMERGKATDDANNLRTLGSDMHHYLSDANGSFFSSDDQTPWPKTLYNYSKDWKHFRSPFDRVTSARPKNYDTEPVPISYGLSDKLFDTFNGKWTVSESVLIQAAPVIDLGSGKDVKFNPAAMSDKMVKVIAPGGSGQPTDNGLGTHQKRQKINVLFADGHVDTLDWHKYADTATQTGKSHWDPKFDPTSGN